ncbi:MAG: AraC family transcriptional regulator [Nannocystaceae bacterium]|nr:AraC family transcriptional regulator [Nannocystaceae bacterium]
MRSEQPAVPSVAYREVRPSQVLQEYIECYWTLRTRDSGTQRVLPDGCVDLLIDRLCVKPPEPKIIGAMRHAQQRRVTRARDIVAVRFTPGGARALLQLPVDELTDTTARLSELMGAAATEPGDCLRLASHGAAIHSIDDFFKTRVNRVAAHDRRATQYARACLASDRSNVCALSQQIGVSRQHLRRQVLAAAGVGPKALLQIGRLRRLTTGLTPNRRLDAKAAVAAGYCDQSHMANEFRLLTGSTPTEYVRALQIAL